MSSSLRLFDLAPSPNNFKVRLAAALKGIEYERVPIMNADRSAVIEATGQSLTPAIAHGDVKLFDSHAIVRYLDGNFAGPKLFPLEREAHQAVEKWELMALTELRKPVGMAFGQLFSDSPDADVLRQANDVAQQVSAPIEEALANSPYLVDDAITAADVFCATMLHYTCVPEADQKPDSIAGFFGTAIQLGPDRQRTREWCGRLMAHCPE